MIEGFLNNNKKIIFFALLLLSIFLIAYRYTEVPNVWLDEGVFTEVARNILINGNQGLQTAPGEFYPMYALTTSGYPLTLPVSASIYLFGMGLWQVRLPLIIYMLLFVLIVYLFTKDKFGLYSAMASVLLILSFAPFYGNGRPVQGELPGLFFLILTAFLILCWEKSEFRHKNLAILTGLMMGISASSKPIFLLVFLASSPFLLYIYYKKNTEENGLRKLLYFGIGLIVPIFFLFWFQFPNIEALKTIVPVYKHLISNHESTIPIYDTVFKNLIRFITEQTPIIFTILFGTIVMALGLTIKKEGIKHVSLSVYFIVFFILINWGAYLVGTGWYRYFFPAHILTYVLFPWACIYISGYFESKGTKKFFYFLPVLILIVQFGHFIFLSDTSPLAVRTRNNDVSNALSRINKSKTIFFYNTIETILFFSGQNYYQYLLVGDSIDAGDKNFFEHPFTDYVLTNKEEEGVNLDLACYSRKEVNKYYFYEKISNCSKS